MSKESKFYNDISSQVDSIGWGDITELPREEQEEYIDEWITWGRGKEHLETGKEYSPLDYTSDGIEWVQLASAMYEFDPKRFNEEIEIADSIWQEHFEVLNNWIESLDEKVEKGIRNARDEENVFSFVYSFLGYAASLKKLNPKKFEGEIAIKEKHWEMIAKTLEKKRGSIGHFVRMYENALNIDAQKTAECIPISKGYWQEIMEAKGEVEWTGVLLTLAIAQNRIKPNGYPDITFSQEQWEAMKEHLGACFLEGYADKDIFRYMDTLKKLQK